MKNKITRRFGFFGVMAVAVVTIESIGDDGTIRRTVLGPPSEKNIF